ncbi:hypothetical protein [Woeseia oceani]|nr:hypothetical protein [Woeseia oceani]
MQLTKTLGLALLLLALSACGNREVLEPYASANQSTVSLAGNWVLEGDSAAIARELNRAIRQTDGVRDDRIMAPPRQGRSRSGGSSRAQGGLTYVFFENADALKITQTPSALFISFNRAIVEEYRFGEMRRISVGQAEAQRVSGWDGPDYVVETLDRYGMKISERYSLSSDREKLVREVTFRGRNNESATVVQTFARTT